ncbi:hypothetical protein [Segatella copri]|uniref:hypothetical protein n=1 Tax=Segatella copri TaxID=165179 RepID=UPI0012924CF4|nr:hypothetical protein [Segatella copri]
MKKTEMRGRAFFNGKEGRDDFRTKAQAPLADQNSGRAIASPATSFPSEKGRLG